MRFCPKSMGKLLEDFKQRRINNKSCGHVREICLAAMWGVSGGKPEWQAGKPWGGSTAGSKPASEEVEQSGQRSRVVMVEQSGQRPRF